MNKNKSTEVFCRPSGEVKKKKNHCKLFFHHPPQPPQTTILKRGFSAPEKHLWELFCSLVCRSVSLDVGLSLPGLLGWGGRPSREGSRKVCFDTCKMAMKRQMCVEGSWKGL